MNQTGDQKVGTRSSGPCRASPVLSVDAFPPDRRLLRTPYLTRDEAGVDNTPWRVLAIWSDFATEVRLFNHAMPLRGADHLVGGLRAAEAEHFVVVHTVIKDVNETESCGGRSDQFDHAAPDFGLA